MALRFKINILLYDLLYIIFKYIKFKIIFYYTATTPASDENKSGVLVMNNYFGIGLDADLCLAFHNARKENPQKFQSRYINKIFSDFLISFVSIFLILSIVSG